MTLPKDIRLIPLNVPIKKFEATGRKVIVWVEPPPDKVGHLMMPDGSKKGISTPVGRVIAVGPGVPRYLNGKEDPDGEPLVREGDRILLYDNTIALEIRHDGDILHALDPESIIGRLPR